MTAVDARRDCGSPADTGVPALPLIAIGGLLLIAGVLLLVLLSRGERRGATGAVFALLLVGCAALAPSLSPASEARAGTPGCLGAPASTGVAAAPAVRPALTILQTSTMTGLAPGVAPVPISGTVTNRGTAGTFVAAVTVAIVGVSKAVGAPDGACDAGDYVMLDATMPVRQTLEPGDSAAFAGARIGFRDTAINQDACQRAIVALRYVSS